MTDLVPHEGTTPGPVRGWLERQPALPTPARVVSTATWWASSGSGKLAALIVRSPLLVVRELRPIAIGLVRALSAWARWCAVADYADAVSTAEGSDRAKHQEKVEQRKSGRRRLSFAIVTVAGGAGWWLVEVHPQYAIVAGIGIIGVLDLVGRAGTERIEPLPMATGPVLRDGVPLRQITATLLDTAARESLELTVAREMTYDSSRREYRVVVHCADEIRPEHIRAFERGLGADDHTMRNLATGTAGYRELVIRDGDPLAEFVDRDWIDTGTCSIAQPLDLGVSMTEVPFALTFAGVHVKVVGASGSGKTKWFLRTLLDRLSSCRDCVIWGLDLTAGPEMTLWRDVIQRKAFDPEAAEQLLDAALAEMDRRARILKEIAEDDDPSNDCDEWHAGLGPALVIVADEFSQTAEFDGKGGKPNLLGKSEAIVRAGRKHWISMVMLTQKTGNSDFGSQTMTSQAAVSVMLACDPRDTVTMVGVERRDAGYAPHQLAPGVEGDPRDAGKCYIDSPAHRTADIYRCYAPGSTAEVKRRARQRIADGLPTLHTATFENVIEATEVPPLLMAVERAFGDAEWMATADLLEELRDEFPDLTEMQLAAELPAEARERQRRKGEKNPVRGYLRVPVVRAMDAL